MTLTPRDIESKIASKQAISHHYDVGNDFYSLWLDPSTMSYTAGIHDFQDPADTLDLAQLRKLDHHAQAINIQPGDRILDIGCGWGGFLRHAKTKYGASNVVGLTLSTEQKAWVDAQPVSVDCQLTSWVDYTPDQSFDGIVSIEAFEAFARPELSDTEKIQVYREFFKRCHSWLKPGGCLSLQLIPYGNARSDAFDAFISQSIFPESNFPRLPEVMTAFEYLFEVVTLVNDRAHYIETLRHWRKRLKENRAAAVAAVGEETVVRYDRYFRISEYAFTQGNCDLIRMTLRRTQTPQKWDI